MNIRYYSTRGIQLYIEISPLAYTDSHMQPVVEEVGDWMDYNIFLDRH
jgi:hypothetical protein